MKQLLSLFLFLLPCLAWAQYPSNGNQKITLGEQTTADGLIFRGVLADTGIITPSSDTSAYIILDTANHRFYNYNRATNVWSVAGGGTAVTTFSGGSTGLTPSTATSGAVTLGGTLAVANGGTGSATQNFVDLTTTQTVAGAKTFSNAATFSSTVTAASTLYLGPDGTYGSTYKTLGLTGTTNGSHRIFAGTADNLYIAAASGRYIVFWTDGSSGTKATISTTGAATFSSSVTATTGIFTNYAGGGTTGASLDNTGQIVRTSSIELKNNISNIKYGLNDLLKIKPISFNWIDENKFGNENENGFIAEDVYTIIPNVIGSDANGIFMDYTKLIPILTKAIQEQQALIKALEQRIINLENK
jgi:hypothetical protein